MTAPHHRTPYEVLGVAPDASAAEIRRAYVRLARDHHPDHHAEGGEASRRVAERRMQEINDAWRVLGDPDRRSEHDLARGTTGPAAVDDEPEFTWRPYDDIDIDLGLDDLDPFGDARARRPTGGRLLAVLPASCLVIGLVLLVLGALVDLPAVMALGLSGLVFGVVLFVLAPLIVVLDSRRHDRL